MKKRVVTFLISMFYAVLLASVVIGFVSGDFGSRGIKSRMAANAPFIVAIVPLAIWWMINYFKKKKRKNQP